MIELYDWRTPNGDEIEGAPFSAQSPATAEGRNLWFRQTMQAAVRDALASEIQALADRQWHDYRTRQPGTCFADPGFALDLSDAYELQDAVAALRVSAGDRLVGYKVGCIGAGTVQQFGMAGPIRGCLFESEVRQHCCTVTCNEFANLAIEGEMAVRLGAEGTIAAVFPVIELHHFVFRGTRKTLPELVANNGFNGGVVLPGEDWLLSRDYTERPGELSVWINDRLIASGELWPMRGGVHALLGWLREHLARKDRALRPEQIILTGTPLGLYPVRAGDRVVVRVDGKAGVECSVL